MLELKEVYMIKRTGNYISSDYDDANSVGIYDNHNNDIYLGKIDSVIIKNILKKYIEDNDIEASEELIDGLEPDNFLSLQDAAEELDLELEYLYDLGELCGVSTTLEKANALVKTLNDGFIEKGSLYV
jgi:hypothetical protein